jgi:hypothetical protein
MEPFMSNAFVNIYVPTETIGVQQWTVKSIFYAMRAEMS